MDRGTILLLSVIGFGAIGYTLTQVYFDYRKREAAWVLMHSTQRLTEDERRDAMEVYGPMPEAGSFVYAGAGGLACVGAAGVGLLLRLGKTAKQKR
jgi:hypothetical protein